MENYIEKLVDFIYNQAELAIRKIVRRYSPPTIEINTVTDIDLEVLKKLKSEYGIGGLIIDVDDTLRTYGESFPECNKRWLEYMKKEFKVCVVSAGYDYKIEDMLTEMNIKYDSRHFITKRKAYTKVADVMGLEPENILVIGDHEVRDIYAANKSRHDYCNS